MAKRARKSDAAAGAKSKAAGKKPTKAGRKAVPAPNLPSGVQQGATTTGDITVNDATSPGDSANLMQRMLLQMERMLNLLERNLAAGAPPPAGPAGTGVPVAAPAGAPAPAGGPPGARLLKDFRTTVQQLNPQERAQLIDAALFMLEQVYVHLPLKRAMHAIDPIQALKILKQRSSTLSERSFHDEMIAIFHSLRDLHTNYVLPASYQNQTAFLPFLVEEFFDGAPPVRNYVVTKLLPGATYPDFQPGVLLKYWNGTPIDRVVEMNAQREAGSNEDARHARGLEALTIRPMGLTAPPDEDWVVVGYESNGKPREHRFDWQVFVPPPSPTGINLSAAGPEVARILGVDARTEAVRRARKALFSPASVAAEQRMAVAALNAGLPTVAPNAPAAGAPAPAATQMGVDFQTESVRRSKKALFFPEAMAMEKQMDVAVKAAAGAAPVLPNVSLMPDVFAFQTVQHPRGPLGYIRIYTFMVNDEDAFVTEFIRIARLLPSNGLILDVRGNGGGNILAGERLLQVLTPRRIEPERFHFINGPITLELCGPASGPYGLPRWAPSIQLGIETGENYSQGFALEDVDDYNRLGQQYQGPVVLIIDALCYSTTDIFTAGFQDHKIGKILGVHQHTGAGGANVWEYRLLGQVLPNRFGPLPQGATFRVALRRTTRVGDHAGVPVEDLGVQPNELYSMTRRDVLQDNVDLIQKAADMVTAERVHSLSGQAAPGQSRQVQIRGQNVSRVDVYSNDRPATTGDLTNGQLTLDLPAWVQVPGALELRGFDGDDLAVIGRVEL
jgi:C-terminal processing protease CtpA/Prc